MGRVFRYKKRFCHLTILLEGEAEAVQTKKGSARKVKAKDEEAVETKVSAKAGDEKVDGKTKDKKTKTKKKSTKSVGPKGSSSVKAGVKKTSTMQRKGNR